MYAYDVYTNLMKYKNTKTVHKFIYKFDEIQKYKSVYKYIECTLYIRCIYTYISEAVKEFLLMRSERPLRLSSFE